MMLDISSELSILFLENVDVWRPSGDSGKTLTVSDSETANGEKGGVMNGLRRLIMVITLLSLSGLISACATVRPDDTVRAKVSDAAFAKPGDTIHLFYGMSKMAKEEFCPNAVVPVYRMGKGYYVSKEEVGKVKVTKDLGAHYLEGVVVEGEIRSGDIAMQAHSECLIKMPD
jgi:hypothetical protein